MRFTTWAYPCIQNKPANGNVGGLHTHPSFFPLLRICPLALYLIPLSFFFFSSFLITVTPPLLCVCVCVNSALGLEERGSQFCSAKTSVAASSELQKKKSGWRIEQNCRGSLFDQISRPAKDSLSSIIICFVVVLLLSLPRVLLFAPVFVCSVIYSVHASKRIVWQGSVQAVVHLLCFHLLASSSLFVRLSFPTFHIASMLAS